jgi:simple sugar transport system ATP-binding protein
MSEVSENQSVPACEFRSVTKSFGDVVANRECSFAVLAGTVHGVVGENGAGKSTILKSLYGMHLPDSGEIWLGGTRVRLPSPQAAIRRGIGMVHQHFMLVPTMTVWQNVVLGREPSIWPGARRRCLQRIDELQREFGFALDLDAIVEDLSVGLQQQVEILKLLYREATILILDEPTAVLTPQEVETLLARLERLRDRGKTIIFISHKLKEILRFTQNVTVMREGRVIVTAATHEFTESSLAETMIGRHIDQLPDRASTRGVTPVLRVRALSRLPETRCSLKKVSFDIYPGEIVGIAGVEGNGQQDLIEILAGVESRYGGEVVLMGQDLRERSTYDWKQHGLAVVPPDRHRDGVVLPFTVRENILLGHHRESRFTWRGRWLAGGKINREVADVLEKFDVRPRRPDLPIAALSGGNQQKVVVGRELSQTVKLLVAAHLTRGVDIGAIEFLHRQIASLRERGTAVLLISSELDELLTLADRILVLYEGRIQGEAERRQTNEAQLGLWMTGATP